MASRDIPQNPALWENAELNRSTRALCSLPAHLLLPYGVTVHAFFVTRSPDGVLCSRPPVGVWRKNHRH